MVKRTKRETKTKARTQRAKKTSPALKKGVKRPVAKAGQKMYYAYCVTKGPPHTYSPIHGYLPWSSTMYTTWRPANNAARMHNKMAPGHTAIVQSKTVKPKKKK